MKSAASLGLMLVLAAVVDCGHDTSEWDTQSACKLVANTICESTINCAVEKGEYPAADRSTQFDSCLTAELKSLCGNVTVTVGNPNECESNVARMSCDTYVIGTGLPLPGVCTTNLFK